MFFIDVPDNISDKGLLDFFRRWKWRTDIHPPITINFETCNFIAPYAAALFAAYALWLREDKRCHVAVKADIRTVAGSYLVDCGLLELLGQDKFPSSQARPDRIVKLTRISTSSEIPKFASCVMDILRIEDEELAGAVQYSLIELLRNVVQHSASKGGGVAMAQYYPSTGIVDVCVADLGLGPPRQNTCRPDRTENPGGAERTSWLDTDKHSRTGR